MEMQSIDSCASGIHRTHFQQFQEEVVNTENKLSFAKQAYNDSTERFNSSVQTFPTNFVAGIFGEAFKKFTYWELAKEDKKKKEDYVAKL